MTVFLSSATRDCKRARSIEVETPGMRCVAASLSSTYTPGDKYSGIAISRVVFDPRASTPRRARQEKRIADGVQPRSHTALPNDLTGESWIARGSAIAALARRRRGPVNYLAPGQPAPTLPKVTGG